MDAIKQLFNMENKGSFIFMAVLLIIAVVYMMENLSKFKSMLGFKTKWDIQEENEQKAIKELETEVDELKKDFIQDCENRDEFQLKATQTLNEIHAEMIDDRLSRIRWEILDFSNSCKKRDYNKEAYDHILDLYYSSYHQLLQKYGRSNGTVDIAIEHIEKSYVEKMETGFPTY